jgi:hypothetical protein
VCALAANRQTLTVTEATIAAEIHEALDVHRDLAAKITLDDVVAVDRFADLKNLGVGELIDAAICRDADALADVFRELFADPMDVLERDDDALLGRNVYTCYTGHVRLLRVFILCLLGRKAAGEFCCLSTPKIEGLNRAH